MQWIEANAGWLWLVLAAGLAGVELLTLDLVFLMIAAGAGAAGVVALVGGPLALQLAARSPSTATPGPPASSPGRPRSPPVTR